MDLSFIKNDLETKGYCMVPNVLSHEEAQLCASEFKKWQQSILNHDEFYNHMIYNGIYKHHQVGHTWHAWFVRTRPRVQEVFKHIWDCDDLIVSFDGSCYIPKECTKQTRFWTHTDQAPDTKEFNCVQGFMSFTENKERTFVVYEGTHKLHQTYFQDRNIQSTKNWQVLDPEYVSSIQERKKVLHVKPGTLVLWDSRTFHQNQYGAPNTETRMVQYVCFFPKTHIKNTLAMQEKRRKYLEMRRTTTHWPAPIQVIALQPNTYGDNNKLIDYDQVPKTDLSMFEAEIEKII